MILCGDAAAREIVRPQALAILGNIVEEANVSHFSRAGNNVAETNFAARKQENVFALSQTHICFSDINFASATCFPV